MKSTLRVVLSVVVLSVIQSGFAAAQQPTNMTEAKIKAAGGRQMKGAELKSMIAGNTVYFITLTQVGPLRPGTVGPVWHPDERRRFLGTGNGNKVEALWWVDGDSYCNERKISGPGHSCNMVWESNGSLYFCPAQGDCIYSARIVPGNPEKL